MSATGFDDVETREWSGSTFDPSKHRVFSILPPEDASEGYCVRHDQEMDALDPIVHRDGAVYTTAEGWHVYSCAGCRRELGALATKHYRRSLALTFGMWDDPDGDLEGAFRFLGEGSPEEVREAVANTASSDEEEPHA